MCPSHCLLPCNFIATIGGAVVLLGALSPLRADPYSFSLSAGRSGVAGAIDGPAAVATFNRPVAVAVDQEGNLFIGDTGNFTVRKLTATGIVTTVAGLPGTSGYVDGSGREARFNSIQSLAVADNGIVYVTDRGPGSSGYALRKITPSGEVTTLVPADAFALEAASGLAGNRSSLRDMGVDGAGNIYLADAGYHVIRRVTPAGTVSTFAGRIVVGQPPVLTGPGLVLGVPINTSG
jgi:hypothetical protein